MDITNSTSECTNKMHDISTCKTFKKFSVKTALPPLQTPSQWGTAIHASSALTPPPLVTCQLRRHRTYYNRAHGQTERRTAIPILLYGLDAVPLSNCNIRTLLSLWRIALPLAKNSIEYYRKTVVIL